MNVMQRAKALQDKAVKLKVDMERGPHKYHAGTVMMVCGKHRCYLELSEAERDENGLWAFKKDKKGYITPMIFGVSVKDVQEVVETKLRPFEPSKPKPEPEYEAQSARDAQASGYGDKAYWNYLEASAKELRDKFLAEGDTKTASHMMTRSLSDSLKGNDGI